MSRAKRSLQKNNSIAIGVAITVGLHLVLLAVVWFGVVKVSDTNPLFFIAQHFAVAPVPPVLVATPQEAQKPLAPVLTAVEPAPVVVLAAPEVSTSTVAAEPPVQMASPTITHQPSALTKNKNRPKKETVNSTSPRQDQVLSAKVDQTHPPLSAEPLTEKVTEKAGSTPNQPRVVAGWTQRQILYRIAERNRAATMKNRTDAPVKEIFLQPTN